MFNICTSKFCVLILTIIPSIECRDLGYGPVSCIEHQISVYLYVISRYNQTLRSLYKSVETCLKIAGPELFGACVCL